MRRETTAPGNPENHWLLSRDLSGARLGFHFCPRVVNNSAMAPNPSSFQLILPRSTLYWAASTIHEAPRRGLVGRPVNLPGFFFLLLSITNRWFARSDDTHKLGRPRSGVRVGQETAQTPSITLINSTKYDVPSARYLDQILPSIHTTARSFAPSWKTAPGIRCRISI